MGVTDAIFGSSEKILLGKELLNICPSGSTMKSKKLLITLKEISS